ncbi:MAG: endolytic transglycosylase MltG [Desulfovibrionaceae bacterium]|nr:endolytic transglycosylase MltG [Desulfovibrionaceae bacterium]
MRRVFLVALILCLVFAGYAGYRLHAFLTSPPEKEGREVFFDVVPGSRLSGIAERLAQDGIITDSFLFTLLARVHRMDKQFKSGRFALKTSLTPLEVLEVLVHGKPVLYRITIPEGLPWWKTARLLADQGFVSYDDFVAVVQDKAFLRRHGIPFANAEGFLMPDTYLLKREEQALAEGGENPKRVQAERIAARLIDTFWKRAAPLWPSGKKPASDDLKRFVILASIVEKETGRANERERVAGVYANRLARKMLLQADPTVQYGLGPSFSGRLLYRHLDDPKNAYNTYQHQGLPPGPICSFGTGALKAAIEPEKHDFLFFVARSDGGEHVFSKRLEDHNKAVEEYRKSVRKNRSEGVR